MDNFWVSYGSFNKAIVLTSASVSFKSYSNIYTESFLINYFYKCGSNDAIASINAYLVLQDFLSGSTVFIYLKNLSLIYYFLKYLAIIETHSNAFIFTMSILSTINFCQISRTSDLTTVLGTTFVYPSIFYAIDLLTNGLFSSMPNLLNIFNNSSCF